MPNDIVEIRAASAAPVVSEGATRPRITGHFARFGSFNEIDSAVEGRFLERILPGAFKKTFAEQAGRIRMLFQHGRDPQIGDKPIGDPEILREDNIGPYFEGDLFDSVPPLIVDGLRAGQYGISYRFSVIDEEWDHSGKRSDVNPLGLPERTIKQARVFEFGPVTFPADHRADYAVRSLTLADLDAAYAVPEPEPALPADAEAEPHVDAVSREADAPVTSPKENATVADITQYRTLDEMGARVRELDAEIKRAAELPGILPETEQAEFDEKVAERAALDHAMTAWRNRLAQVRVGAADPEATERSYEPPNIVRRPTESDIYDVDAIVRSARTPEQRAEKLRDNAMRSVETVNSPHPRADQDGFRAGLAQMLDYRDTEDAEFARRILNTGSPLYRRDFNRYVRSGGQERGTALAVGVDGTGGFAVPYAFDPTVLAVGAHTTLNPYRQVCRVETIVGTDTYQVLTASAITAAYATEAAAANEQGPTFVRPEFIAKRAQAFVTVSYEMAQDRPDIAAELSTLFQEAKDNLEENQFSIGAGTTVYPQGIALDGAFTATSTTTNDTTAVADLFLVEAALPLRHRSNAVWFMTRKGIRAAQAWETAYGQLFNGVGYPNTGRFGRPSDTTANTGLTLIGYPLWESPSIPWTPTTDATINAVLFNPDWYLILDRVGMSVRVIPDMLDGATPSMPTGQIGVFAMWRNTARVIAADAGRQMKVQ